MFTVPLCYLNNLRTCYWLGSMNLSLYCIILLNIQIVFIVLVNKYRYLKGQTQLTDSCVNTTEQLSHFINYNFNIDRYAATNTHVLLLSFSSIFLGILFYFVWPIREETHKKCFFLVVGQLRFYSPHPNGLVVHFFVFFCLFSLIIAWNGFWQFFFSPIFGLKVPDYFWQILFSNQ